MFKKSSLSYASTLRNLNRVIHIPLKNILLVKRYSEQRKSFFNYFYYFTHAMFGIFAPCIFPRALQIVSRLKRCFLDTFDTVFTKRLHERPRPI